jgi:transcriptional regulator with PAS, ATPase and Fis domain
LQEGTYLRVGGREPRTLDVRVIAASNVDLEQEVDAGRFRSDLYYRLNVVPVVIPPLRDRRDDIALLSHHFLSTYGAKYGKKITRISAEALDILRAYSWPGNVRELENVIERGIIVADEEVLLPSNMPRLSPQGADEEEIDDVPMSLEEMEKYLIVKGLRHTGGHKGRTADILGISPVSLWRKIKKYNL